MAKEPAGLRRWRLAHRKHKRRKHKKVFSVARRRYYGKKRRGGRRSKAIPVLQTFTIGVPVVKPLYEGGLNVTSANQALWNVTGMDAVQGKWTKPMNGVAMAVILLAESTIGAKIANRSGANRILKKMTGGMLKFA